MKPRILMTLEQLWDRAVQENGFLDAEGREKIKSIIDAVPPVASMLDTREPVWDLDDLAKESYYREQAHMARLYEEGLMELLGDEMVGGQKSEGTT